MEDLRVDIKMRVEQDRATPTHSRFWPSLMVVCDHEIAEGTKRDILDRARVRGEEGGGVIVEGGGRGWGEGRGGYSVFEKVCINVVCCE